MNNLIQLSLFFTLLSLSLAAYSAHPPESSQKVDFRKLNILSKFSDLKEAQELEYSLNKSGQKVRIVSKQIDQSLLSLSIGLFSTRKKANYVVNHLKKNQIASFVFKLKNGKYRVHAGAIKDEEFFWLRYEKLLSLGYNKPHTATKTVKVTEYYIVSDKREETSSPISLKPIVTKTKNSEFTTEFHQARFKGEFSMWGDEGSRSSSNYFSAALSLRTKYKSNLDITFGTRFDATEQSSEENVQKFEFQWQPTYLRYIQPNQEWTMGAIDAMWDPINPNAQHESLSDRLSSRNLVRYKLDTNLVEKRRPLLGARWKFKSGEYKLDVIMTPIFRPAKLPDFGSIWHPVRRSDGAIRGIKPSAQWQELVQIGSFADEKISTGGAGVRMSHQVGSRTRAFTLQYARQSEPYYALNPEIQRLLSTGKTINFAMLSANGYTFTPEHPYTGTLIWEESGKVSHFEFALSSNTPYSTKEYEYKTAMSIAWKLGFIYPKTKRNLHVSGYLIGRYINTKDAIIDRKRKFALFGELFKTSKSGIWKFGSTYEIGLDSIELYLNPRLTLQQSRYVKIYLNYSLFTGAESTASGYHTAHSILSLTWQAKF